MAASLFGCVPRKGAEEFLPPEIVSSRALVQGSSVSLECTLSDSRVESCGFAYGVVGGEKTQVTCELTSVSFAVMIGSLTPGSTYEWYAFVRAGAEEIRSGT